MRGSIYLQVGTLGCSQYYHHKTCQDKNKNTLFTLFLEVKWFSWSKQKIINEPIVKRELVRIRSTLSTYQGL